MKKYLVILTVLALVLGMGIAVYASDDPNYTDNLNLWKPSADDRTAALPDVNANWDTLDSILGGDTDIEMLSIGGDITAVGSGSTGGGIHTRPLTINRTRTTVQLNADSSDTGAFIRIQNSANQPTGYWLTGLDCEARVTGSGSETTNLYGANITAHGHITSSGGVVNAYGLKVESKMNAQITGNNKGLYVRMFRQSFNHPSTEYGIYLENANDAETG